MAIGKYWDEYSEFNDKGKGAAYSLDDFNKTRIEFGITYSESDKVTSDNKKRTVCRDLKDQANYTECFEAYLKPPVDSETLTPYFSYMKSYGKGFVKGVIYRISQVRTKQTFSDDTVKKKNRWKASIPVTLIQNKKLDVKGGLSFNWQERLKGEDKDKVDRFSVGIFVNMGIDISKW